jgi:hypothetical protein
LKITCISRIVIVFLGLILLTGIVSAAPTITGFSGITSNSVNVSATGVTGDNAWAIYGLATGAETWISSNYTPTGGTVSVQIWGAPLLGSSYYFVQVCDDTGCSAEDTFTTAMITPVPVTNYGAGFRCLTQSHFNVMYIAPAFLLGYFNIMPASIFFGLLFGIVTIGMWRRNRGIRLVSIVMIILSPLIMSSNIGLMMGIPLVEQALGQALLAAGISGILLSFIKK